jgi:tetratricopeptide (TPR) repeat protein
LIHFFAWALRGASDEGALSSRPFFAHRPWLRSICERDGTLTEHNKSSQQPKWKDWLRRFLNGYRVSNAGFKRQPKAVDESDNEARISPTLSPSVESLIEDTENAAAACAQFDLGISYEDQDKYDDAVAAYRQAIKLRPDYKAAWYALGLAYGKQGKRSEALNALDHIRKLDPSLADKLAGLLSPK